MKIHEKRSWNMPRLLKVLLSVLFIAKRLTNWTEDPYWVAPAYKKNQPKAVYAKNVYEDEDEERQEALKKRRQ